MNLSGGGGGFAGGFGLGPGFGLSVSLGYVGTAALPSGVAFASVAFCLSLLGSGGDLQSTVTWPGTAFPRIQEGDPLAALALALVVSLALRLEICLPEAGVSVLLAAAAAAPELSAACFWLAALSASCCARTALSWPRRKRRLRAGSERLECRSLPPLQSQNFAALPVDDFFFCGAVAAVFSTLGCSVWLSEPVAVSAACEVFAVAALCLSSSAVPCQDA